MEDPAVPGQAPAPPPDAHPATTTSPADRPISATIPRSSGLQSSDATLAICRICRGEGTPEEPLFYPCKCSGSIKFVHQECLMEWLSHSQKKYCELCKTSFRFTKLYAPDMPQSLPIHVFIQHMARYVIRNVLNWARAILAISIWVCWLPFVMRAVWSFLFWVSDEGFGSGLVLSRVNETGGASIDISSTILGQSISEFFIRILLGSVGIPFRIDRSGQADHASGVNSTSGSLHSTSSLLGDVRFLRNLTPNQTVNKTVTTILEGQIITVLVIICFILVILVRDYVVQQQPEINMRAAFAPAEDEVAPPEPQPLAVVPTPAIEQELHFEPVGTPSSASGSDAETLDEVDEGEEEDDDEGETEIGQDRSISQHNTAELSETEALDPNSLPTTHASQATASRPASESRIEDHQESASVNDYMRIFREASGDKARILQIIEDEGLQDKLSYWVEVTKRGSLSDTLPRDVAVPDVARSRRRSSLASGDDSSTAALTPSSSEQSPTDNQDEEAISQTAKGKQKWEPSSPSSPHMTADENLDHWAGSSRSRALSDGPQPSDNSNPLANNSWTFAALPLVQDDPLAPRQDLLQDEIPLVGKSTPPASLASESGTPDSAWTSINDDVNGNNPPVAFSRAELARDNALQVDHQVVASEVDAVAVEVRHPDQLQDGDNMLLRVVGRVMEFMWGGLDEQQLLELAEEDLALPAEEGLPEEQWVDEQAEPVLVNEINVDAPELDIAAAGGNMDPEAIEDLEDFEGVMELIGMRGPIAGLFQNAIFCAVLVTVTIFACIFFPYNIGRLSIWVTANPMRLARMLFEVSKLLQDATICLAGIVSWFFINLVDIFTSPVGGQVAKHVLSARKASWALWTSAGTRVLECLFLDFPTSASEIKTFSAVSHHALLTVRKQIGLVLSMLGTGIGSAMAGNVSRARLNDSTGAMLNAATAMTKRLLDPSSWVLDFSDVDQPVTIDPALAYWPGSDRFWAIFAGYATIFLVGAAYLKRGSQFPQGSIMQAWEAGFIDTLHQASGIVKVILIISIEMLVFPLYCGLLLDAALLPLFEGASFRSRTVFTCSYPLTSIFVHWFVGTGYMFHFALFVSMCRKIMRPGVLYFIRDPDDPEFHPVRDVLERNFTTQLRKILFSAFVYGALVIVCLGGVVWGLSWSMPSVLPIHYSSNEPVLEFPVDLLFYNFLMPLAVKFFKPSDGLHTMYTWWFRKCARGLHLTLFLFGERRIDEEGKLHLAAESPHQSLPFYRRSFLEISKDNEVVPKTWQDTFTGGNAKPGPRLKPRRMDAMRRQKAQLVESGQLVEEGHFVRAPASDRVKIPKGQQVFLPVFQSNYRKDRKAETDLYSSDQYQFVYIPPHFRLRVFLFILNIWVFAAVTGVALTIIPLMLGRTIFKSLIPDYVRTNDIYAFSIGTYLLGSAAYGVYHARRIWQAGQEQLAKIGASLKEGHALPQVLSTLSHVARLAYAYSCLLIFFPLLLSGLMELYVAMPLHTYLHPPTTASVHAPADDAAVEGRHTIRVMQAWTLGLLYVKLGSKLITTLFPDTRLAAAVRTVLRRGWLQPDVAILTRAFVVPGVVVGTVAIMMPPLVASLAIQLFIRKQYGGARPLGTQAEEALWAARMAILHRASYPLAAFVALMMRNIAVTVFMLQVWSSKIRDEAYLIGERLHNFGVVSDGSRRGRTNWKARGARL